MSRVRVPLLLTVLVAVFAVSVTSAFGSTEFIQKPMKAGNHGKALGNQVFKTKAGEVICASLVSTGGSIQEKSAVAFQEVKYEKCKAFGIIGATISPAQYEFNANGKTAVLNTITIKAGECEVEVSTEGNKELGTNAFEDSGSNIKIKAAQKGITYKVNKNGGGLCGTTGKFTDGVYSGEAETETYTGAQCVFVGGNRGEYSSPACTVKGAPFAWEILFGYGTLAVA